MISKIVIIAVVCVAFTLAEAPINRYRFQRFRQAPPRQFFARQESPYPAAQGGEPAAEYGPPTTPAPSYGPPTTPAPSYGPPSEGYGPPAGPGGDVEITNSEIPENTDSEVVGQPSRFTEFNQKLTAPSKKSPQKFSQRLELQQEVKQFPGQQLIAPVPQFVAPVQQLPLAAPVAFNAQPVAFSAPLQQVAFNAQPVQQVAFNAQPVQQVAFNAQPVQPVAVSAPLQLSAPVQQEGSYYIQLPSGSIQRVNYLTEPSVVDNSVLAKLQFRPVAEVSATVSEPQLYVNTVVQSQVSTDDERKK